MIDIRKLSDNGFGKGLVMDTSPLNQDNNTLSNCLNGTTLTFNGNEFILLNDMGNGRVETAYLPAGYVPVGMKEYGGIIYVASYNPKTNKGLIGCFPSPEKNISDLEAGLSPITINLNTFSHNDLGLNKYYEKIPLLGDQIIRPGDKFSLGFTSNNISNLVTYLTDFGHKGNRLFRLGVAILDKEGNLQDITNLLKQYSNSEGSYFLKPDETDSDGHQTVDDIRIKTSNANIYGGKVSGQLYLTAEVNTPQEYELMIDGMHNDSDLPKTWEIDNYSTEILAKKYALYFKGIFKDNIENGENYWKGVKVNVGGNTSNIEGHDPGKKEHSFIVSNIDNQVISYSITPCMIYGELSSFTKSGEIDLSLLNSGVIKLTEFKYYNDYTNGTIYLNWGLATYLRNNEFINNINFNFYEYDVINKKFGNKKTISTDNRKSFNGNFMEAISYELLLGIKNNSERTDPYEGNVFLVQIEINKRYNENPIESYYFYRILYTSTYFNPYYVDTTCSDFKDISIDLSINTKLELSEKNVTGYPLITQKKKTPESYIQDPKVALPFEYSKLKEDSIEVELTPSYELEGALKTLPFVLDESKIETSYTINSDLCLLDTYTIYSNSKKEYTSHLAIHKVIANKNKIDKLSETNKEFGYSSNLTGNKLSVKLNSTSQFVGDALMEEITSNKRNYIPYMNNFTPLDTMYNFPAVDKPLYGFSTMLGGSNDKDDPKINIARFVDYKSNGYTLNTEWPDTVGSNIYENDRVSSKLTMPSLNKFCNSLLANAYKRDVNPHLPVFIFWIGGSAGKKPDNCTSNINYKGIKTSDYIIALWKSKTDLYYVMNSVFKKSGTENNAIITYFSNMFKNLFVELIYSYNTEFYKTNNYSYTQDYKINYTCDVHASNKKKGLISDSNVFNFDINLLKNAFNSLQLVENDITINYDNIKLDIETSFKINLNLETSAAIPFIKEFYNYNIDTEILPYVSIQGSSSNSKALLTFTEDSQISKVYTTDYAGNQLTEKIYYLGKTSADSELKAYPIRVGDGFAKSELRNYIEDFNYLGNLSTDWDNNKKYNQIIIDSARLVYPTDDQYPSAGNLGGGIRHLGYASFKTSQALLNFSCKNIDKLY